MGLCLDIHWRKQAEERRIEAETALRRLNEVLERQVESHREQARLLNLTTDAIFVLDMGGTVTTGITGPRISMGGRERRRPARRFRTC